MREQQHSTNTIERKDDHAIMIMYSRKGERVETLLDLEDVARVLAYGLWRPGYRKNADAHYPVCRDGLYLHRFLMAYPSGLSVDHANGNTLDNRKQNLRIATHQQNMQNKKTYTNNSCGFRNVSQTVGEPGWRYAIKLNNKRYSRRGFPTAEAASAAAIAKRKELGMWDRIDTVA